MSSFSYGTSNGLTILAVVLAIAATVLAFIFLVPEKRREKLNGLGKFVHDTLNFKYLIISKVMQALYIFNTAFVILAGFFMLFQTVFGKWLGGYGLLMMLLGPIVVRVVYELLMLALLLVQNVISINRKLRNQNGESGDGGDLFAAPDLSGLKDKFKKQRNDAPASQGARFCFRCGTPLDPYGNCPSCGPQSTEQTPPPFDGSNYNG